MRSRRVCFLAHCLLNQNTIVEDLAPYPHFVRDLIDVLDQYRVGIEQLPCPETLYLGLTRFWHVKEQYSTVRFRRFCRELANSVADLIEEFVRCGYTVLFIMGIRGSPSCGVRETSSAPWRGCPWKYRDYSRVPGAGTFMEELRAVLVARGLNVPFLEFDYSAPEKSLEEVRRFLEERCRSSR